MKKIFCLILICFCPLFVFSQAKKNLAAKKNAASKNAKETVKKEEIVTVFNEDYETGEKLFGLNKPAEAIPYFEKCVELENINPNVWIHLGVAYYQTGDFTRSLACCTRGLTKENTDHKILAYNAGNSAYALTNYARADACYAIAIREDENFGPAYLNRANAQLKQDHLQDAKQNYEKYLELEPKSSQRPEIERLISLLDEEIARRAKEKPELIDLDFANVKNDEVIVEQKEKVDYELPEEKVEDDEKDEELVRFEIVKAPPLPQKEDEIVENETEAEEPLKVVPEDEPVEIAFDGEEPVVEAVEKSVATAPVLVPEKAETEKMEEAVAVQDEKKEFFGQENLADALYSLPAGVVTLKALNASFSPNSPNSRQQKQIFNVSATDKNKIETYVLEITDEYGNTVKTIKGKKLPDKIEWDGKTDSGRLADGRFSAKISVNYRNNGSVDAEGNSFSCFSNVPQITLIPESDSFSPDGDGIDDKLSFKVSSESEALVKDWKFEVKMNNRTIYSKSGTGTPPENIEWDGKTNSGETVKDGNSLSYKMSVTDALGVSTQDSGKVEVTKSKKDPVVAKSVEISENPDGTVNIAIPTLSFKINSSELVNTEQNSQTLKKVYDILVDEKYEEYRVTITGYVNPDGEEWTTEEQVLALNRAKSVENRLKGLGVPENRMEARCGEGKSANKEYNRRVEFKLRK